MTHQESLLPSPSPATFTQKLRQSWDKCNFQRQPHMDLFQSCPGKAHALPLCPCFPQRHCLPYHSFTVDFLDHASENRLSKSLLGGILGSARPSSWLSESPRTCVWESQQVLWFSSQPAPMDGWVGQHFFQEVATHIFSFPTPTLTYVYQN